MPGGRVVETLGETRTEHRRQNCVVCCLHLPDRELRSSDGVLLTIHRVLSVDVSDLRPLLGDGDLTAPHSQPSIRRHSF
jgi:hypothetical protein